MYNKEKANWLRAVKLANGTELAISDRSGIIKVTLPGAGMRSMMIYRDELLTLAACLVEIQQYAETNQDVAFSAGQASEARKIKTQQERAKAKVAALLHDAGIDQNALSTFLAQQKRQA